MALPVGVLSNVCCTYYYYHNPMCVCVYIYIYIYMSVFVTFMHVIMLHMKVMHCT